MKRYFSIGLFTALVLFIIPAIGHTHCQMPCGIYDDQLRYDMLNEDITTIEKSMNMINQLSKDDDEDKGSEAENDNQIVRWVMAKEDHVDKFVEIVTQYFLTQRIKLTDSSSEDFKTYQTHLQLFHEMMVYAMKCRQTTDTANTDKLRELVGKSEKLYFQK